MSSRIPDQTDIFVGSQTRQPAAHCCAPQTVRSPTERDSSGSGVPHHPNLADRSTRGQVRLPPGTFAMGDAFGEGYADDGETPVHEVTLPPFWIDQTAVTNAAFATFVKASGHVTEAERFGFSAVFHLGVDATPEDILSRPHQTPWWLGVRGADWRHPEGPKSSIANRQNHPVVHVSWADAQAYCAWAGKRLPTEAEWEYASRGGLGGRRFAWGDELTPKGRWMCNIWQGHFPSHNTAEDGYLTTAPVKAYRPNRFELWNTAGNVWEWCADWFAPDYYTHSPTDDPSGPDDGTERVVRGGSFLCHHSYCHRYRVAARSHNTPDSSAANTGFRCANDA
jgi:formylglycine-generating enzyme